MRAVNNPAVLPKSAAEQILKICNESEEALAAVKSGDMVAHTDEEVMDVMHACYTYFKTFRHLTDDELATLDNRVDRKNAERGYFND